MDINFSQEIKEFLFEKKSIENLFKSIVKKKNVVFFIQNDKSVLRWRWPVYMDYGGLTPFSNSNLWQSGIFVMRNILIRHRFKLTMETHFFLDVDWREMCHSKGTEMWNTKQI